MGNARSGTVTELRAAGMVLLLVLALSACGAGGAQSSGGSGGGALSSDDGAGRAMPGSGAGSGGSASAVAMGEEMASAGMEAQAGGSASAASVSSDGALPQGEFDRRIVKTADLGVRARSVREAAAEAQRIVAGFGGSVVSSRVYDDGSVRADLVLSVPSGEFEAALDGLRGLGEKVTTDAVSGEDVTEEFVDLESRERNLLAAEASLLELYEKAESVDDTLTVERELTNVRGEIEEVQGRLKYLESRTTNSEISLGIGPVPSPAKEAGETPAWDPAGVVAEAWGASLAVLQSIATAVISAVVFGWWIAPALVAGLLVWRRRSREATPTTTDS